MRSASATTAAIGYASSCRRSAILTSKRLRPCLYEFTDSEAAIHLFRVACGIDSLVIGESQILGQVRASLEAAQQSHSARLLLNELFQRALKVGKRARTETDIGRGHLSISTAAVELAGRIFDRLDDKSALLLGAGEMMTLDRSLSGRPWHWAHGRRQPHPGARRQTGQCILR